MSSPANISPVNCASELLASLLTSMEKSEMYVSGAAPYETFIELIVPPEICEPYNDRFPPITTEN